MAVNRDMEIPQLDPSTMQGLVEGTLSPADRKRALGVIAASPADRAWFLEASAVFDDLSNRGEGSQAKPAGRTWLLLAAAVVFLVAGGVVAIRLTSPVEPLGGALVAGRRLALASSRPTADRFGPEWAEAVGIRTRGEGVSAGARTSIQIGVSLTDLAVGTAARDSAAARQAQRNLVRLLSGVPGGGPAARLIELALWDGPESDRQGALEAAAGIADGRGWATVGSWLELARLAEASGAPGLVDLVGLRQAATRLAATDSTAAGWLERLADRLHPGSTGAASALLDTLLSAP